MEWSDEGIILAVRPHGESSLILTLLTNTHGHHTGLVRAARRSQVRGIYQVGNSVQAHWQARLSEHLGHLRCELLSSPLADFIEDPARLACLAAAAALADSALPERESAPSAFAGLQDLLQRLRQDRDWARAYVGWELALLGELGFGLELSRCAASGSSEDLIYVSPKSAQAVSRDAGAPYRDKLLPLPAFLREPSAAADRAALLDGLRLTGYFLERHVLLPLGRHLPPARARFVDRLSGMATISGLIPPK